METTKKEPAKMAKTLGFIGIGLCALCCALPIVGIIGSAGILSTISLYADHAALVFLILSAAFLAVWFYRKRHVSRSCSTDCSCQDANDTKPPIK